jgi:serine/threonine protein kinase
MSHNGTYKIIDFGFSKKLEIFNYEAEINLTALGTRTTMAPEVFSKKPYGLKVYSKIYRLIFGLWESYSSK